MKNELRQKGQGMTEYIIIIAVVAILSLAVVISYGDNIRHTFFSSGSTLVGKKESLENHMDQADVQKTLEDL